MATTDIQFVTNSKGEETAVIVPISLWRDIEAERETAYLLSSPTMRQRLTEALSRTEGIPLEDALEKLRV
jgi:PHD/YefM family antitoxin component YafN of YafNO toxin-antitoxin module